MDSGLGLWGSVCSLSQTKLNGVMKSPTGSFCQGCGDKLHYQSDLNQSHPLWDTTYWNPLQPYRNLLQPYWNLLEPYWNLLACGTV